MNKVLLMITLSILIYQNNYSQDRLSYEEVIKVDSVSRDQIYFGLKEWLGMNYNSAKTIIEIDDKEAGLIIVTPKMKYSINSLQLACYDGYVNYTLKFQVKDGRFKVTMTNFIHDNLPGNKTECEVGLITNEVEFSGKCAPWMVGYNNKIWNDIKSKSQILFNQTIVSLKKIPFSDNNKKESNDNW